MLINSVIILNLQHALLGIPPVQGKFYFNLASAQKDLVLLVTKVFQGEVKFALTNSIVY